jgi:hypothetical protein
MILSMKSTVKEQPSQHVNVKKPNVGFDCSEAVAMIHVSLLICFIRKGQIKIEIAENNQYKILFQQDGTRSNITLLLLEYTAF